MNFSPSARASTVAVETNFRNLKKGGAGYLPMKISVIGQGNTAETYDTDKRRVFSADEVGAVEGYGSPLHLAVRELLPANGDGVGDIPVTIYPLDDDALGVASAGSITPSLVSQVQSTYLVRVNGIYSRPFVVLAADVLADVIASMIVAINAVPDMPIIASDGITMLTTTSKWKGVSANDITLVVEGPTDAGVTWAFAQHAAGAVNPDITAALAMIGPVWETMIVNCMEPSDTTTLDLLVTENVGRWDPQVWTPFVAFTGNNEATYATAIAECDARTTDYTNAFITAQGSECLPLQIAARGCARVAKQANENPAASYNGFKLDTIRPGTDAQQWKYAQLDAGLKAGFTSSTLEDEVVTIGDVVTFYHPSGETDPKYRFVVTLMKLWNHVNRMNTVFRAQPWRNAPMLPDIDESSNPLVKKPKDAVAEIAAIIDSSANDALIAGRAAAKKTITAAIDGDNNNRLNTTHQIQIAGNTNIKAMVVNYGFYYGG